MSTLERGKRVGLPCPYMVYDPRGYHGCAISTELFRFENPNSDIKHPILCAWFFDICDDGIKTRTSKEVVPKICPRQYTYEEIDAKIQCLMKKCFGGKLGSE